MASELEAIQQTTDFRKRRYLMEQINLKDELIEAMEDDSLSVGEKIYYTDAIKMVKDNIQKMRVEGMV